MDGWSGRDFGIAGQVKHCGIEVRFHAPYFDRMTDDHVRYVVAHELVHVLQWAEGRALLRNRERAAHTTAIEWLGLARMPRRTRALVAYSRAEIDAFVHEHYSVVR